MRACQWKKCAFDLKLASKLEKIFSHGTIGYKYFLKQDLLELVTLSKAKHTALNFMDNRVLFTGFYDTAAAVTQHSIRQQYSCDISLGKY